MVLYNNTELVERKIPQRDSLLRMIDFISQHLKDQPVGCIIYGSAAHGSNREDTMIFSDIDVIFLGRKEMVSHDSFAELLDPIYSKAEELYVRLENKPVYITLGSEIRDFTSLDDSFGYSVCFDSNNYIGGDVAYFRDLLRSSVLNKSCDHEWATVISYLKRKYEALQKLHVRCATKNASDFRGTREHIELLESIVNGFKHLPARFSVALKPGKVFNTKESYLETYATLVDKRVFQEYKDILEFLSGVKERLAFAIHENQVVSYLSQLEGMERFLIEKSYFLKENIGQLDGWTITRR